MFKTVRKRPEHLTSFGLEEKETVISQLFMTPSHRVHELALWPFSIREMTGLSFLRSEAEAEH